MSKIVHLYFRTMVLPNASSSGSGHAGGESGDGGSGSVAGAGAVGGSSQVSVLHLRFMVVPVIACGFRPGDFDSHFRKRGLQSWFPF